MGKIKRLNAMAIVLICFVSMSYAGLPTVTPENLLLEVQNADALYSEYEVVFNIEELYVPGFERRFEMPEIRSLNMTYRTKGEMYRYDVQVSSDDPANFPAWSYVDAWNGSRRTQWDPDSGHGDIFGESYSHAFAVPADFGLSAGGRGVLLGQELAACQITEITTAVINDHECYLVSAVKSNGRNVQLWIDPAINWRARKIVFYRTDGKLAYESQAEWTNAYQGIWFPNTGTAMVYGDDPGDPSQRIPSIMRYLTVQSAVLSELNEDKFEVTFPHGAKIYDHIIDLPYVLGDDGELHLIVDGQEIKYDPAQPGRKPDSLACGSACTGTSTCASTSCVDCTSKSGGSYSTCKAAYSGSCTNDTDVKCGTVNYCNEGQGGCQIGLSSDCDCNEKDNTVKGC